MGEREIVYLSLLCHHQNDSCVKKGNDESHFNVSFIVRDKVTRQCPFFKVLFFSSSSFLIDDSL